VMAKAETQACSGYMSETLGHRFRQENRPGIGKGLGYSSARVVPWLSYRLDLYLFGAQMNIMSSVFVLIRFSFFC